MDPNKSTDINVQIDNGNANVNIKNCSNSEKLGCPQKLQIISMISVAHLNIFWKFFEIW